MVGTMSTVLLLWRVCPRASKVAPPYFQELGRAFSGFLLHDEKTCLVTAEINMTNAKKLVGFLGDRLGGKPIELSVEANGKKLTVKAHSREELEAAIKAAQDFVAA